MKKKKIWVTFWFCVLYPFQTGRISTGAPVEVLRSERYLLMNSRWTPMNFWAKVTHLDPYSLIESSSVFNGGSRGRNPVWKASRWTPMKMPMKFWVLRAAATYTSCWAVGLLTTSFAVEWFSSVFTGVWSERVEEKFIGVLRAEFSPLIHREFNGCQRVKSVWKGYYLFTGSDEI